MNEEIASSKFPILSFTLFLPIFEWFFHCFKTIMQLVDSDWPANILAGSHFRAQETRALSPDGVCALARARLGTRLWSNISGLPQTIHDIVGIHFQCVERSLLIKCTY